MLTANEIADAKRAHPLKNFIETWGGKYIASSDVEVAAEMHPRIRGTYPLTFALRFLPIVVLQTSPTRERRTICLRWITLSKRTLGSRNRRAVLQARRDRVKVLTWDGSGLVLYYKRIEDSLPAANFTKRPQDAHPEGK